jgi:hypothetical protein
MTASIDTADVRQVSAADLFTPMRMLILQGKGLALLRGLREDDLRALETAFWAEFKGSNDVRLAVALRFRALLDVFANRRLKDILLHRGFKLIARAIEEAATQRLNTRFGFSAQKFVAALDREIEVPAITTRSDMRMAA